MPALSYAAVVSYPFPKFTKIYSADTNAMFAAISTLLNTTKLDSTNVQGGGLTLDRLATGTLNSVIIRDNNTGLVVSYPSTNIGALFVSGNSVTAPVWLGQGTSGQTLTSNGTGVLPTWTTPAITGVSGGSLQIVSQLISVANGGVNTTQLADSAVSTAKLLDGAVTGSKMANATITGTQVSSSINLPGNSVQENGKNVVVSSTNASASLALVRGSVNGAGTIIGGEGFTITHSGTGAYVVTYSVSGADAPCVGIAPIGNYNVYVTSPSSGGFQVITDNGSSDQPFMFVAASIRA